MEKNRAVYNSKAVVNWYRNLRGLLPVEKIVFEKYAALLAKGHVLDIGIGGGRTTAYLLPLCHSYTGIDYSANFIAAVKQEFPSANCQVMDARDLSTFASGSFDLVNFSFNGIDYVNAEGRKKVLSEIQRVLKPNGIFFFSTHNKSHPEFNRAPWLNTNDSLFTRLKTLAKLLPFWPRKLNNKNREIHHADYAVINDSAHNYSLSTFYTTPAYLREQLTEAGFSKIVFFDRAGISKSDAELEDWIFASAQKASV